MTTSEAFPVLIETSRSLSRQNPALEMNFFKDLFESAFENDANLSSDKSLQQLEGPDDAIDEKNKSDKSDVQKRWLEQEESRKMKVASFSSPSLTNGAPMNPALLENTSWCLSLYLTGLPDFDPSSSLYGARVNISARGKEMSKEGFAIGADQLPENPTVVVPIRLLKDGICFSEETPFTTGGNNGQWKLSEDCRTIRLSLDSTGYQRTITTKGTIQNIYWSERDEIKSKTSATYSIKPGWIYAEAPVGYGSQPGIFVMANTFSKSSDNIIAPGILRVEERSGLFGASSKQLACGKFSAEMLPQKS